MPNEFSIIEKYFNWGNPPKSVALGVGDDAAILNLPHDSKPNHPVNQQLVTSVDTLIAGVHFPTDTEPYAIGHKALAVNLSDLAAMGADPAWFTLALTLPEENEDWLEDFSNGLKSLAQTHSIHLIGGDTTKGALSITIQVMGFVETDKALKRSGAKDGDRIYVTGTLGDAAAGLKLLQNELFFEPHDSAECINHLEYPQPRNHVSRLIRGYASSCIDISDGTLADLQHILDASKIGANVNTNSIPLSPALQKLKREKALELALTGGDDYELLFTLSALKEFQLAEMARQRNLPIHCIGTIDKSIKGIKLTPEISLAHQGFQHF